MTSPIDHEQEFEGRFIFQNFEQELEEELEQETEQELDQETEERFSQETEEDYQRFLELLQAIEDEYESMTSPEI